MRRVVVTGMAGICALGSDWPTIETGLRAGRNAVRRMPAWDMYRNLNTRLAAPIEGFRAPGTLESQATAKHGASVAACRKGLRAGAHRRRAAW